MSTLRLQLLGPPRIERDGVPLRLKYRKNIALLAYLAVTGQPHTREVLITLLWPELEPSRALANLRRNLSVVRKALGDEWVVVEGETVGLNPSADVRVDVDRFPSLLQAWRGHAHEEGEVCPKCLSALTEAVALYRDGFLAGFTLPDSAAFDEWQFFETEGLQQELASALERLVHGHSVQGSYGAAIPYARRWVALDPLHEPAHRELMALYANAGQRAAALPQYQECTRILGVELALSPSEETTALYERIRTETHLRPEPHAVARRPRHNLPAQVTAFIGREAHIVAVRRKLLRPDVRLLTLTGAGGMGKTRLALQVAAEVLDEFEDGVFFVTLAPVRDPALVMSTVAASLGIGQFGGQPPLVRLKEYLSDKQVLLVLDNFEHVVPAAPEVTELLSAAPQLKALVTSRALLRMYGEHTYPVPQMVLPEPQHALAPEQLRQVETVKLFCQRAEAVRPDSALNADNGPAVAEVCTRLDGLPLAIELAAVWVRLMLPEAMLSQLGSRLRFLTGGARDLPGRHQTLRATIDWSHELLDGNERALFRRLAVFAGGCTLQAAEAVANAPGGLDVIRGLEGLVDKSLLQQSTVGGETRFTMLETVREYAWERLEESGEAEATRERHARFFVELAEEAQPELDSWEMAAAADRMQAEHDNLRAALEWSLDGAIDVGLRLAAALGTFWHLRAYHSEGRSWLSSVLARSEGSGTRLHRLRARALTAAGSLALFQTDYAAAVSLAEESLELWRALGDESGRARALHTLGIASHWQEENARVRSIADECVALCQETGDALGLAYALFLRGLSEAANNELEKARASFEMSIPLARDGGEVTCVAEATLGLGTIALVQGDYAAAQSLCEEAVALERRISNRAGIWSPLCVLGLAVYVQGDLARAKALWQEAFEVSDVLGNELGLAWSLGGLGLVSVRREEWEDAKGLFLDSLAHHAQGKVRLGIAFCLTGLAVVAHAEGLLEHAARLLGAARAAKEASAGNWMAPFIEAEYDRITAILRAEIGEPAFTAAWAEGRSRDLEATADELLAELRA